MAAASACDAVDHPGHQPGRGRRAHECSRHLAVREDHPVAAGRRRAAGGEQPGEPADEDAGVGADHAQRVGVALLRHHHAAARVPVRQLDPGELVARPDLEVLGELAQRRRPGSSPPTPPRPARRSATSRRACARARGRTPAAAPRGCGRTPVGRRWCCPRRRAAGEHVDLGEQPSQVALDRGRRRRAGSGRTSRAARAGGRSGRRGRSSAWRDRPRSARRRTPGRRLDQVEQVVPQPQPHAPRGPPRAGCGPRAASPRRRRSARRSTRSRQL